jgi:hypothetical protein
VTEAEWLAGTDPYRMLYHLACSRRPPRWHFRLWRLLRPPRWYPEGLDWEGDRKLRLLACACCRRVARFLTDQRSLRAIEVNELYADGEATAQELAQAARGALEATGDDPDDNFGPWDDLPLSGKPADQAARASAYLGQHHVWSGVRCALDTAAWAMAWAADPGAPEWPGVGPKEALRRALADQADLVRELLGNPFRPAPALDPAFLTWQGGAVRELARAAYEERRLPEGTLDAARLALLADALDDAGCGDPELLDHLHGPGVHVRGCWAVDLLLSRD